jgi:hypothetical protein
MAMRVYSVFFATVFFIFHFSYVELLFFIFSSVCLHCLVGRFDFVAGCRALDRQIELKPLI